MTENKYNFCHENREYLIKQGEMLQSVISRITSNSFTIKQLGITIWTTLMGFGFANKNRYLFLLAIISVALFCLLDACYLYLERRFRRNFSRLTEVVCGFSAEASEEVKRLKGNFIALDTLERSQALRLYREAVISWASFPYLVVLAITLAVFIAI